MARNLSELIVLVNNELPEVLKSVVIVEPTNKVIVEDYAKLIENYDEGERVNAYVEDWVVVNSKSKLPELVRNKHNIKFPAIVVRTE